MKKRISALILAITLALSIVPTTAGAASTAPFVPKGYTAVKVANKYTHIEPFYDGMAAVFTGWDLGFPGIGSWGFIDETGKEVIPLKFEHLGSPYKFSNGYAKVYIKDKGATYIDKTGKAIVTPGKYTNLEHFNEYGVARCQIPDGLIVFINGKGKEIFSQDKYKTYFDFGNGLLKATDVKTGLEGFLNTKGEVAIPFVYRQVGGYDGEYAWVRRQDWVWCIINRKNEVVYECSEGLNPDMLSIWGDAATIEVLVDAPETYMGFTKYVYSIDVKTGKTLFRDESVHSILGYFEDTAEIYNGDIAYPENYQTAQINRAGEIIIPFGKYPLGFTEPNNGIVTANVSDDRGKYKYGKMLKTAVDAETGEELLPQGVYAIPNDKDIYNYYDGGCFESAYHPEGMILAHSNKFKANPATGYHYYSEMSVYNRKGEVVVPFGVYEDFSFYSEGLARAYKGDLIGCINKKGQEVIPLVYHAISMPHEGKIPVGIKAGTVKVTGTTPGGKELTDVCKLYEYYILKKNV